jgi:hypothetical protein
MSVKLAYSMKEAVAATGLSATSLDVAIRTGKLRCRRTVKDEETGVVTGKRLILAADLQAYLDALPTG